MINFVTLFINVATKSLFIVGLICNIYVLYCLSKIRKKKPTPSPVYYLLTMCINDIVCLFFLLSYQFVPASIWQDMIMRHLYCKSVMFGIQSSNGFSTWLWLALSMQRYLAIFHASSFKQRKWIIKPRNNILLCLLFMILVESFLLASVLYDDELDDCNTSLYIDHTWMVILRIVEISCAFILPACAIMILDYYVRSEHYKRQKPIVCQQNVPEKRKASEERMSLKTGSLSQLRPNIDQRFQMEPSNRVTFQRLKSQSVNDMSRAMLDFNTDNVIDFLILASENISHENSTIPVLLDNNSKQHCQQRMSVVSISGMTRMARNARVLAKLKKYIALTILDLCLNMPIVLVRLAITVGIDHRANELLAFGISQFAYLLYSAQFVINLLYLFLLHNENDTLPDMSKFRYFVNQMTK